MTSILSSCGVCAAVMLGSLLVACGSDDDSSMAQTSNNPGGAGGQAGAAGGVQAGAGGSAAGAGGSAAGAGGSAGGVGGSAGGSAATRLAAVLLSVERGELINEPELRSDIFAYTRGEPLAGLAPNCTQETIDGCRATFCQSLQGGSGGSPPAPTSPSLGVLTITGAAVSPIAMKANVGSYTPDPAIDDTKAIFVGGETIEARATGGELPAFTVQAKAPVPLQVEGFPAADLDTTKDLTLTLGQGDGQLAFVLNAFSSDQAPVGSLVCSRPLDGSPLVIKASTLQKLKETNSSGSVAAFVYSEQSQVIGDMEASLILRNYLVDGAGQPLPTRRQLTFK